jgi:hypothetical protein
MLCIGYAKSAPDEGLQTIDRPRPLTRFASGDASHLSHKGPTRGEGKKSRRGELLTAKPLRGPGVQASGHGRLVAAAFWGNVKPDNFGVADQR